MSSHATQRRIARTRLGSSALTLAGVEAVVAAFALVTGALLLINPDGSLVGAQPSALSGSPFSDYRWPGLLLLTFVGVGFSVAALAQWTGTRYARELSVAAGIGLVAFESFVLAWLGFQGLEVVFALVGLTIAFVALGEGKKERAR